MQFFKTLVVVAAAAVGLVSAADITVLVGDGGLAFNPTQVTAQQGDNVIFEFRAKNHSVTQSSFAQPCTFLQTAAGPGVDSGFQPVPAGSTNFPQWSITIDNATAPLWFYCAQAAPANHCQAGMVFAINPTAEKSFDAFQAAAKAGTTAAPSGGASAPPATATGGASVPGTAAPTASGFSTAVLPTNTPATTGTSNTSAPGSTDGNGALGMKLDTRAATMLAAVGLLAGLIL